MKLPMIGILILILITVFLPFIACDEVTGSGSFGISGNLREVVSSDTTPSPLRNLPSPPEMSADDPTSDTSHSIDDTEDDNPPAPLTDPIGFYNAQYPANRIPDIVFCLSSEDPDDSAIYTRIHAAFSRAMRFMLISEQNRPGWNGRHWPRAFDFERSGLVGSSPGIYGNDLYSFPLQNGDGYDFPGGSEGPDSILLDANGVYGGAFQWHNSDPVTARWCFNMQRTTSDDPDFVQGVSDEWSLEDTCLLGATDTVVEGSCAFPPIYRSTGWAPS